MEGQSGVPRQLLDHICHRQEGVVLHTDSNQSLLDLINVSNKGGCADAGTVTGLQQAVAPHHIVQPLGQIHIYIAINGFQTGNVVQINGQTGGNNSSIGLQAGHLGGCIDQFSRLVTAAVKADSLAIHSHFADGRLNGQCADGNACVRVFACSILHRDQCCQSVGASMDRCGGTCIGLTVGLHACVQVLYIIIRNHIASDMLAVLTVVLVGNQ